jgi:hypothetical protein
MHHLALGALAFGLVVAPAKVQATEQILIDESVEGATPSILNSPALNNLFSSSVTPLSVNVGEAWTITLTISGMLVTQGGGLNLLEPGSGLISDALVLNSVQTIGAATTWNYTLFSDDDLGRIAGTCVSPPGSVLCGNITEVPNNLPGLVALVSTTDIQTEILLTSDADAVPEPATWAMMLLGFVGLGFVFKQSRRKVSMA